MNKKAGLYIHIPFCKNKCPYCDFYSVKYNPDFANKYVAEVISHFKNYSGEFDTVYFGGGTPSIIEPQLIEKIIQSAKTYFDIDASNEITVECNPSKDLKDDFKLYRSYGVNRVSIGMQSAVDSERFALGRSAGRAEVARAVNDAKNAGIENISLDLMIGTPKQSIDSLDYSFDFIDKMQVKHISAYILKIETGTKFYQMQNKLALPDDDTVANMYLKTVECLNDLGLKQYEISNFAVPGYQSKHNNKYWELTDYLGIGKAAHSFWHGKRFYYDYNFNKFDDGNGGGVDEQIMLGLRLTKGVPKSIIKAPYQQFVDTGLMIDKGDNIALTPQGMLVSNTIINELI